ncbi:MAG: lysophospholipase [Clostridia bacterium]|nr:lysophospholipase [Clostridia bacterium]
MLNRSEIVFDSAATGRKVKGFIYKAEAPKATVQICHGMAEYIWRYEGMIAALNEAGYTVCGIDMLGHGETSKLNKDPLGYFGDNKDSYENIFEDNLTFHNLIVEDGNPGPYILYGHSMGSFVVRAMYSRSRYAMCYDAFIFSSTKGPEPLAKVGHSVSGFLCKIGRSKKPGKLVNALAFGSYNKRISHPKTIFDWLSTDEHEVTKYVEDPLCGFYFTNKGFQDLLSIILWNQNPDAKIGYCKKPCLFTYGDQDPVTGYGKGVKKVINEMKAMGIDVTDVEFKSYRHELMNDYCRVDYYRAVIDFLDQQVDINS